MKIQAFPAFGEPQYFVIGEDQSRCIDLHRDGDKLNLSIRSRHGHTRPYGEVHRSATGGLLTHVGRGTEWVQLSAPIQVVDFQSLIETIESLRAEWSRQSVLAQCA